MVEKITPEIVEKIENVLEERKTRRDRRNSGEKPDPSPKGSDRRSGKDRRNMAG